jgi:hypothetical protein
MDYYKKYLKYKSKYLSIKTHNIMQLGGADSDSDVDEKQEKMNKIIVLIDTVFENYGSKEEITSIERLEKFNEGFNNILSLCKENFKDEAEKYYTKRKDGDKKFDEIQEIAYTELNNIFKDAKLIKAFEEKNLEIGKVEIHKTSSVASKTHVIGESDIDFTICIGTELVVAKFEEYYKTIGDHFLVPLGFTYHKLYDSTKEEEKYQVFTKKIDGIEIEAKIRNLGAFGSLLKYHNYMNDKLEDDKRIYITYIKYLLSKPKKLKQYSKFKWIMMEFGFFNAGVGDFFGPLDLNLKQ